LKEYCCREIWSQGDFLSSALEKEAGMMVARNERLEVEVFTVIPLKLLDGE
jgi:hypothetical protein